MRKTYNEISYEEYLKIQKTFELLKKEPKSVPEYVKKEVKKAIKEILDAEKLKATKEHKKQNQDLEINR